MEQTEQGQQDHNILATLPEEPRSVDHAVQKRLADFVHHVFDHMPGRVVRAGRFLGAAQAWVLIENCRARDAERGPS